MCSQEFKYGIDRNYTNRKLVRAAPRRLIQPDRALPY